VDAGANLPFVAARSSGKYRAPL